jgi:hypothetical protein
MANNGGDTNCSLIYNSTRVLSNGWLDLNLGITPDYSLTSDCVLLRVRYYSWEHINSSSLWRGYDWYYNASKVANNRHDALTVKTAYGTGTDWNVSGTYYRENIWYAGIPQYISIQDTGSNIFYYWSTADYPRASSMGVAGTPIGKPRYVQVTFMPNCPASSSGWKDVMLDYLSVS